MEVGSALSEPTLLADNISMSTIVADLITSLQQHLVTCEQKAFSDHSIIGKGTSL